MSNAHRASNPLRQLKRAPLTPHLNLNPCLNRAVAVRPPLRPQRPKRCVPSAQRLMQTHLMFVCWLLVCECTDMNFGQPLRGTITAREMEFVSEVHFWKQLYESALNGKTEALELNRKLEAQIEALTSRLSAKPPPSSPVAAAVAATSEQTVSPGSKLDAFLSHSASTHNPR